MTTPVNVNYRQGIIDRFVEVLDDMIHDDEFDPNVIYETFVEAVTVDRDYYQKGVDRCNVLLKKLQPIELQQCCNKKTYSFTSDPIKTDFSSENSTYTIKSPLYGSSGSDTITFS